MSTNQNIKFMDFDAIESWYGEELAIEVYETTLNVIADKLTLRLTQGQIHTIVRLHLRPMINQFKYSSLDLTIELGETTVGIPDEISFSINYQIPREEKCMPSAILKRLIAFYQELVRETIDL